MASSKYRVIESADGTFTVELWENRVPDEVIDS
jgi:hypothetical protein